jgi:hypothetical protein
MNSKDLITSTPNTIQNYDNYLKDYINLAGFNWNSNCLSTTFTSLGNNFTKYVTKIGEYNTVSAKDPIPEKRIQVKDYNKPCPEGWTETQHRAWWYNWTTCKNLNYTGPCNAGRTKKTKKPANCPQKIFGDPSKYEQQYDYWSWGWLPGLRKGSLDIQNNNNYAGWNGPTDASQGDFSNTNIGSKNSDEGSFCTAGWAAGNSMGGAQADCSISGGQWVNYYNDPGFNSHGYTCYKPTEYNNETEPDSSFSGYNDSDKLNWENYCQAYWPMKTVIIPPSCTYGEKLEDDIARGNIFKIGDASSPLEAAKIALNSLRMVDNYFFMVDSSVYIIGQNSNVGTITSKGLYEDKCTGNNKKGTLYYINEEFFKMLRECKSVNNSINDTNINRDILQTAINSVQESFTSLENIKDIQKNGNEIMNNLASDYNKKAELYNYQVDLISQNEKLVEVHNKKLNQQLNDLTSIQDQIALKDRVIVLNDELTKKQIRNKKILIGFFVLIPLLGIPLLLVVIKAFSPFIGLGVAALFIIGYIIYMVIVANQNDVKNFGREDKRVISKYENAIANYWNKQKEALSKSLSKFVNGNCADDSTGGGGSGSGMQEEEESSSSINNYIMKENTPFYYYDGTAPPQQIYPSAIGSIDFSIDGIVDKNLKFPDEISKNLNLINNPITKFFFNTWLQLLNKSGINLNDPRFAEDLDVIDYPDSDQTPPPYWDTIKLPIATSIRQQFSHLFRTLSADKMNLSTKASSNLVDLWNFVKGNKIPGDVYEKWVNKLATVLKEENPNMENFYQDFLNEIISVTSMDNLVDSKIKDFIKTINNDISVSQPFVKKYI